MDDGWELAEFENAEAVGMAIFGEAIFAVHILSGGNMNLAYFDFKRAG